MVVASVLPIVVFFTVVVVLVAEVFGADMVVPEILEISVFHTFFIILEYFDHPEHLDISFFNDS